LNANRQGPLDCLSEQAAHGLSRRLDLFGRVRAGEAPDKPSHLDEVE